MQLEGVKKIFPFVISYKGELYINSDKESQIGDIAQYLGKCDLMAKGGYYLVSECYPPNGFKGVIADNEKPMKLQDDLGNYRIYKKKQ